MPFVVAVAVVVVPGCAVIATILIVVLAVVVDVTGRRERPGHIVVAALLWCTQDVDGEQDDANEQDEDDVTFAHSGDGSRLW